LPFFIPRQKKVKPGQELKPHMNQGDKKSLPIELEHVNCDFCGGNRYRMRYRKPDTWLWLTLFEYPVVECLDCGLVYVNPRPTSLSMPIFYPDYFFTGRDSEQFQKQYAVQFEFIPQLTREKVLDIGCANGDWLNFLKNKYPHIHCVGLDIYPRHIHFEHIEYLCKPLTECFFEEQSFDLITAWAVMEHLHQPGEYFAAVAKYLKRGGKFIFLVTNSESLYGRRAYKEDIPRHLYHFSEKILHLYAEKFGFNFSHIVFDDRIWDGRGHGTFYYGRMSLLGVNWEKIHQKKVGVVRTQIGRIGHIMDRIVFHTRWEARRKASGIIICEFTKK
jgi:SAM-dependent methyltransferase